MTILFITGNQAKHHEVSQLLAGIDIQARKLSLSRSPPGEHGSASAAGGDNDNTGADLAAIARARVLEAYAQVRVPCFTETTMLALEGMAPMSGAAFKKQLLALGEDELCRQWGPRRGRARVAVAYSADGDPDGAAVFCGDTWGTFLTAPRGRGGYGWDRAFLPDGYRRTLGEMADNKAFVNMRYLPYLELGDLLRGRDYGGSFEAHVTVRAGSREDTDRFCDLCDEMGVKAVLIELPRGETRSQPMTASYHRGTLREALDEVHDMARNMAANGFDVTRVKLEAVGKNRDIPESDDEAARAPANYFEYHIKVLVPPGHDTAPLLRACDEHRAHLSRNARKIRDDGAAERFVTLRVYGEGRINAEGRFVALQEAVRALGLPLGQRIREYTVYDSDEGVDRGWLDRP